MNGRVVGGLCSGVEGATVSILGDDKNLASTDDGVFSFVNIPSTAVFRVEAEGKATTLNAIREYDDTSDDIEIAVVPEELTLDVHILAGGFDY